ncbi:MULTISPECIES: glycosyltransferase family 4 protein [Halorussus]|uniref:glycosyltransferase family 4 protein n=1 Tax=Halorussus TaxID=1070314 RepID=UPI000E2180BE|nr:MULTISPECIES: glycosyltransferase family 4 protein [Halorussus]NHN60558.1 glycosyltransferase family 4 protein [Halorussus sp. JP-T4]
MRQSTSSAESGPETRRASERHDLRESGESRGDLEVTIGMFHPFAGTRDASGIAVYAQRLVEHLAEDTPTVLYTRDGEINRRLRESSADVVRIPIRPGGVPDPVFRRVPNVMKHVLKKCPTYTGLLTSGQRSHMNENLDILITHDALDDILLSHLVDVPTIRISHGLQRVGVAARAREFLSRSYLTVANSRNTARELEETFGYEADGIVTPGVDTTAFAPGREPAFETDGPAVLFVGRMVENKGVYDLLDALARSSEGLSLHLVGRGQAERVRRRADELGVGDSVTLHGVVDHADLPRYYAACDFLCNPSRYESFGMVNLEAMACGRPVVSTDVNGTTEYFTHGETGLRVPPRDPERLAAALDELAASPERRQEFGRASRERATEYSWEASAETLRDLCFDFCATYYDMQARRTGALADRYHL